jgi:hypothetical protein
MGGGWTIVRGVSHQAHILVLNMLLFDLAHGLRSRRNMTTNIGALVILALWKDALYLSQCTHQMHRSFCSKRTSTRRKPVLKYNVI